MKLFHKYILATAVAGTSIMPVNLAVAEGWIKVSSSEVGSGGFLRDLFCKGHICLVDYNIQDKILGTILARHEINTSTWQFRANPKKLSVSPARTFSSLVSSNSINQE